MRQMIMSLTEETSTLSMQLAALARASKLTPEEYVKTVNEVGANMAFLQNCALINKGLQDEAEQTKEAIEELAIK